MSDFIMTMDDRSDISNESEEGDVGFSFDFNVRKNITPPL